MKIYLSGETIRTKENFHKQIKEKLNLPEYYGNNLDALWDCLKGWVDMPVEIVWRNFKISEDSLGEYGKKIVDIFNSAEEEIDGFKVEYI